MPSKKKPRVIITPDYLLKGKERGEYRGNKKKLDAHYFDWRFIKLKSFEELRQKARSGEEGKKEVVEYLLPYVEQYTDQQLAEMMGDTNWSKVRTFRQSLGISKRSRGRGIDKEKVSEGQHDDIHRREIKGVFFIVRKV